MQWMRSSLSQMVCADPLVFELLTRCVHGLWHGLWPFGYVFADLY